MWSADEGLTYIRRHNPTARDWSLLLGSLPQDVSAGTRRDIARQLLRQAQAAPSEYHPGSQPSMEIDAVRTLLGSAEQSDHDLIRWAVRQYPDAALLWAAVSRLPHDKETARLAMAVYNDPSRPRPVRFAAALAFAKDDPEIMADVAQQIVESVREFGSREYLVFTRDRWKNPTEPAGAERFRRALAAEELLVAANELPGEVWRPHLDELVRHPYSLLGAGASSIAAKKLPDEFIAAVVALDSIPEELDFPLTVAIKRARSPRPLQNVLPQTRFQRLQDPVEEGTGEPLLRRVVLWE